MAFASKEIIGFFNKVKFPYNIGLATLEVAEKALDDIDQKFDYVDQINEERLRLIEQLEQIDAVTRIAPSDSNSLLFFVNDAHNIYKKLTKKLVIVRDRSKVILCENGLRISIGTKEENDSFLKEFKSLI